MKPVGFIAMASDWPVFHKSATDIKPHPVLVISEHDTGINGVLGISHSIDLFDLFGSVRLDQNLAASGFYPRGPLTDTQSVLGVMAGLASLVIMCEIIGNEIVNLSPRILLTQEGLLTHEEMDKIKRCIGHCSRKARRRT